MRRKEREVTDPARISRIIRECDCCRLGLCDGDEVYIVPLNFGYEETDGERLFYFHGAKEGRKIDLISRTHRAGFEMDCHYRLMEGPTACSHSAGYQSVMGTGTVEFIEDPDRKREALRSIMKQTTGKETWEFPEQAVHAVCVFCLNVESLSCKVHEERT